MKRISPTLFAIMLVTLALTACSSQGNLLDGTNWNLQSYQDATGELVASPPGKVVTAQFQAEKVAGISACNNYSGGYSLEKNNLTFTPAALTRKMCTEQGVMELETVYIGALAQVRSFKLAGETLAMFAEDGETLLVFELAGQ